MQKTCLIILCSLCILLLTGCLYTFYPIFTERDVSFNPDLLGLWNYQDSSKKGSFKFERISETRKPQLPGNIRKLSDKGYFTIWRESKNQINAAYFVFLAKIGKDYYLDFFPADLDSQKVDGFFKSHYVAMHSCYKIILTNKNHFQLRQLEESFLNKLITNNQIQMRYIDRSLPEDGRIIISPTAELQNFLIKYSDNQDAYNKDHSYYCTHIK